MTLLSDIWERYHDMHDCFCFSKGCSNFFLNLPIPPSFSTLVRLMFNKVSRSRSCVFYTTQTTKQFLSRSCVFYTTQTTKQFLSSEAKFPFQFFLIQTLTSVLLTRVKTTEHVQMEWITTLAAVKRDSVEINANQVCYYITCDGAVVNHKFSWPFKQIFFFLWRF